MNAMMIADQSVSDCDDVVMRVMCQIKISIQAIAVVLIQ